MRIRILSCLFVLALAFGRGGVSPVFGQAQPLSLREALDRAQGNNFTIRRAQATSEAARAEGEKARAAFLPRISVTEGATATTDPLNAFGFRLRQETITQADFAPARLNDPERTHLFTTRFEVQQPVFNPEGLFLHRAARRQARAAASDAERTRHQVAFEVKRQYFGLVLARRSLAVLDTALTAARANQAQAGRFFEQGLITRAELLEAGVRVLDLERRRTEAEVSVQNASDQLRYLLGMDEGVEIRPTDDLEDRRVPLDAFEVGRVNQERSDMQALRLRTEAARYTLRAGQFQFLPRLNVFGSYELNDQTLTGAHGRGWTVGATLQWTLFDGFRRAGTLARARADLLQARLALQDRALKNEVEMAAARRGVRQTLQQLELARASVAQARENLRIRSDRYEQGLEKTTDVLSAEVLLARQRLAYLEALYRYYVNLFRLELLLERPLPGIWAGLVSPTTTSP